MDYNLFIIDETAMVLTKDMYQYIIDNLAVNHLLLVFTISCTLTLLLCSKKQERDIKYIAIPDNNPEVIKGKVLNEEKIEV